MDIQAKGYTIQMDSDELFNLALSVKHSLKNSLENHWVNHQNAWEKNEESKLRLLKTMFRALGRLDVYDDIFKEAEETFKKFNDKRS